LVFDFSFVLVLATAVTGLVWLADARYFRPRRLAAAQGGVPPAEPVLVEYSRSFFPIILVVLLIRSFLFEPFRIPSDSMMPTLLDGDFIFVNKFTYGLRLPVVNTEIVRLGQPDRGDVVVFRLPSDPATNYIKRLVGLPATTSPCATSGCGSTASRSPSNSTASTRASATRRPDWRRAARRRAAPRAPHSQPAVIRFRRRGAGRPLLLHGR